MAEANRSIPQIHTIRITTAAHTLALFQARKAVKAELQRRGEKVTRYSAKELTLMARQHLDAHRSVLLPAAVADIERWILAGEFGKRARDALCAKLNINVQNGSADKSRTSA